LLESADFVSIHIGTRAPDDPLFDAEFLSKMKSSAFLTNTSTPDAVDHRALAAAVKQRQISGAAVDVHPTHPLEPKSPLLGLSNVILTPHTAGATAISKALDPYHLEIAPSIKVKPLWHQYDSVPLARL